MGAGIIVTHEEITSPRTEKFAAEVFGAGEKGMDWCRGFLDRFWWSTQNLGMTEITEEQFIKQCKYKKSFAKKIFKGMVKHQRLQDLGNGRYKIRGNLDRIESQKKYKNRYKKTNKNYQERTASTSKSSQVDAKLISKSIQDDVKMMSKSIQVDAKMISKNPVTIENDKEVVSKQGSILAGKRVIFRECISNSISISKELSEDNSLKKISSTKPFQKDKTLPSLRSGNNERCSSESEREVEVLKLETPKIEPKRQRSKKGDDPVGANFVIADYATLYREKFGGSDPVVAGANAGAAKTLVRMVGLDEARRIVRAYFEIPDAFYATKNYPLTLLVRDVSKVKTFADTGSTITMGRARQAEKQADNTAAINRVLASNVGRTNGHVQQKRESMVDILASIDEPKNITPVAAQSSQQSNEEAPPW